MKGRNYNRIIVIASGNRGKIREMQKLLDDLPLIVEGLHDYKGMPEIVEDGDTFIENALKKAAVCASHTSELTLADDSGLQVDYLNGRPGVYSARFAGENAGDEENNLKLLKLMDGVPVKKRTASFITVVVLIDPERLNICVEKIAASPGDYKNTDCEGVYIIEGACQGFITENPRGSGGFGYDPLFKPQDEGKTFAQMDLEKKNKISHRGKAMRKARELLASYLKNDLTQG